MTKGFHFHHIPTSLVICLFSFVLCFDSCHPNAYEFFFFFLAKWSFLLPTPVGICICCSLCGPGFSFACSLPTGTARPASLCPTDYLIHWRSVWILFPLGCICYSSIHVSLNSAKCYWWKGSFQRIPLGNKALIDPPCMLEGVALTLNTGVFLSVNLSDETPYSSILDFWCRFYC